MEVSRREFLRMGGASAAAGAAIAAGVAPMAAAPPVPVSPKPEADQTTTSICPYCAVGCGMIVGTKDGRVVNIEGDPEHPISLGALCSKGSTLSQLVNSPQRISQPMYRAPGAADWQPVTWAWTLDQIARRIKSTRDAHWLERDDKGRVVRRTEALAAVGSAALDNEECCLLSKALRAMGLVYIEHQARI
jgi:formate dehydrogenase major subunit